VGQVANLPAKMDEHGEIRRRRLPHWDLPGATYFVTSCLAGSIPAEGLLDVERVRARWTKPPSEPGGARREWEIERWKRTFARCDWWLDKRPCIRHFSDPTLAKIVADACYFWAGQRYDLLAFVVMPSHVHWVFRPIEPAGQAGSFPEGRQVGNVPHKRRRSPRERIMHTLKLHTAIECNRLLGREGTFWQDESYDHCVRDDDELERIIYYIEQNPVKAGLIERSELWRFSSAYDRAEWGVSLGHPLVRPIGC
jgi:type I restriction enzyme R subunit